MKSKNIFWGVLLISIGILWILKSLAVISFSWCVFFKLWPLIFIWIGVKLIPVPDKWKAILNVSVLLIGIAFVLILSNSKYCSSKWGKSHFCSKDWNYKFTLSDEGDTIACNNKEVIEYDQYENANLKLVATAGKLVFAPGKELITIQEPENLQSKIEIRSTVDDDNTINIKAEVRPFNKGSYQNSFKYNILLNNTPVWNMDLELSATAGQIDLSSFKIKELKIESNASSLDFKLGSLYADLNVKVESNASAVKITIPHNMKCLLKKAENNLSSFKVKGLKKQSGSQYVSDGNEETAGIITITVESNVSSVEIKRY